MEKYDTPRESKIREFQVRRKENKREEFLEGKYFTCATEKKNWWIAGDQSDDLDDQKELAYHVGDRFGLNIN